MVAATQPPQQTPAAVAAATEPSAEDEALKRNTDCVYFLASPLTCKKGSECEYRHSEYARVNPRDCYFWLNGNCLNAKCGFRHPPLDGLFGSQASAFTGTSLPPSHSPMVSAVQLPHNLGKQAVPCIFFQKGLCLKGDRCAFSHGSNTTSNKISQSMATTSVSEPSSLKKAFTGVQKCTPEQKISQTNSLKAVEAPSEAKPVLKAEIAPLRNGVGVERNVLPPKRVDNDVPRYKAMDLPPTVNGNSTGSNHLHQPWVMDGFQNGKDADEFLRESSPGFDVLVDDELRDSGYYHDEDRYASAGHERANLNLADEYDIGHSTDFSSMLDIDQETYCDSRGYESYMRMQRQNAREPNRASSERLSAHLERRSYMKGDSPEHIDDSDLRYRLSKQRRDNGLRSVVSRDFVIANHVDERCNHDSSQRDPHHLLSRGSSISSRLHGRISLSSKSPNSGDGLHAVREKDGDKNWGRLSPVRSQRSEGRFRARRKPGMEEDYSNEGSNFRGPWMRDNNEERNFRGPWMRDASDVRGADFARPKSLPELKVGKSAGGTGQQSLRKRKHLEDHLLSEGEPSFEGPMPLSEILKRKREAKSVASGNEISFVNKDGNNRKESRESLVGGSNNEEVEHGPLLAIKGEDNCQVVTNKEESKSATAVTLENAEVTRCQSSEHNPDGMNVDDGAVDHEYEGDDHRGGDYEYEQVDEGDYSYEEGENGDAEEEYVDEEDGDDFAKKIGVMFS